jgi:CubicO group peptidase (beta-lactamase class C family)
MRSSSDMRKMTKWTSDSLENINSPRKLHIQKERTHKNPHSMRTPMNLFWVIVLAAVFALTGCISQDTRVEENTAVVDHVVDEDWRVASPEAVGLDGNQLAQLIDSIEGTHVSSILIVKDGYLIMEEYSTGYDRYRQHFIASCTQSIISALIGIAIDKGYIDSVDQRVVDFFPELENDSEWKKEITIEHLLTMSSGLDHGAWHPGRPLFEKAPDWIGYIISREVVTNPGTSFDYYPGNAHILSALLQTATKEDTRSFAVKCLFEPLDISEEDIEWEKDPQGVLSGSWGLYMRPRDMAKVGLLYLNKGAWDGAQIIPEAWIEKSVTPSFRQVSFGNLTADYGYLWWIEGKDSAPGYFALGTNGQYIYVNPELNLVIVITGSFLDETVPLKMIDNIVLTLK